MPQMGRKVGVVFDHHDPRPVTDRLPHPKVVAIDINRKQIEFARHLVLREERLDVLGRDELFLDLRQRVLGNAAVVHQQPGPTLGEQVGRIAFDGLLAAELDKVSVGDANFGEDGLDNAVLPVLRADLPFTGFEIDKDMLDKLMGCSESSSPARCLAGP